MTAGPEFPRLRSLIRAELETMGVEFVDDGDPSALLVRLDRFFDVAVLATWRVLLSEAERAAAADSKEDV